MFRSLDPSCSSDDYSSDSEYPSYSSKARSVLLWQLETEIEGKLQSGIDLVQFVQQVWGLDSPTIDKILSMEVSLDESQKDSYALSRSRRDAYRSFLAMANGLLQATAKDLGEEILGETSLDRLGDRSAEQCAHSMPGTVNLWTPLLPRDEIPELSHARGILDIKWNEPEDDTDSQTSREDALCVFPKGEEIISGESQESTSNASDSRDDSHPLRECMLPLYAMEALSSGSRYYVTGVLVDGFQVTVCYFDRFLVACTASFSFEDDPAKMALVLHAMNHCGPVQAGFDPYLSNSCGHLMNSGDGVSIDCRGHVEDVAGSYFEYPASVVQNVDGRPSKPISLLVSDVLQRPKELIGRAATVYKVRRRLADGAFSEEPSMYTLSWPPIASTSEADIIRLLKQKLPGEAHDHLPEFLCMVTCTAQDLRLPWLRLDLDVDPGKRILRGTLGRFYNQLWEVGSIDNFKKAWLDCVECLYLAHKLGGTLHPGLGERNLMISNLSEGGVKGVVNGWECDGDNAKQHRTSALQFMAYELVSDPTRPHWFRHTLESMFYILNWAIIHYNLEDGERDTVVHSSLADWTSRDPETNVRTKFCLISFEWGTIRRVQEAVRPEFVELYKEWVCPLRLMFSKARGDHYLALEDGEVSDPVTWGGRITFKKFLTAIKVEPRTWGVSGFLDDEDY